MSKVQLQLSLLVEPLEDNPLPVWTTLSTEQQTDVVTTLARVIAKLGRAAHAGPLHAQEKDDE